MYNLNAIIKIRNFNIVIEVLYDLKTLFIFYKFSPNIEDIVSIPSFPSFITPSLSLSASLSLLSFFIDIMKKAQIEIPATGTRYPLNQRPGNKVIFTEELATMYSKEKGNNEDRYQKYKDARMFWVFHLFMAMRYL